MNKKPMKILRVEDNPGDAGLLRHMCKDQDEQVVELRSGQGAVGQGRVLRPEPVHQELQVALSLLPTTELVGGTVFATAVLHQPHGHEDDGDVAEGDV